MPNWISGSSDWPFGFAVGADGVDGLQHVDRLGPGEEAQRVVPLVSPTARPSTWAGFFWLLGLLRSLGRSMVLCSVTTVVLGGIVGQKRRGEIEIGDGRIVVRLRRAWRCRSPWPQRRCPACRRATRQSCDGVRIGAARHATREGTPPCRRGRGPLHQRAHRRAVALDLRCRSPIT